MKFGALDQRKEKSYRIRKLDGGINKSELPNNIADNELAAAENTEFRDGILKSRAGLFAANSDIIKNETDADISDFSYVVTQTEVYINGEYRRIAYENVFDGSSNFIFYIYFLGADGTKQSAGEIYFRRTTDKVFYMPYSILFYSGAPIDGGGIFALVTAQNNYNSEEFSYMIYEINEDMDSWLRSTSYYEPIIMINGRGNKYEAAKAANSAYTAQPKFLEARNILTSRFKAYFTSDGQSNLFRLPYSGLANESVICRVYTTPIVYTEWVIFPGDTSDTQTFFSAQITMHVDRSRGVIYFTGADGKEYPVPSINMYHENNICVKAGKLFGEELKEICTLTCCTEYDSKLVFSGGCERGKIYSVPYKNPLYFSDKSTACIGSGDSGITCLLTTKNGIIAFKKNEVYRVELKYGSALNNSSLLADNDSVFYAGDDFSQTRLADIGCLNKRTCALCGGTPIWMSGDGKIYSVNTSSGKITEISEPINSFLSGLTADITANASAAAENGRYWLLLGDKALIINCAADKSDYKYYIRSFKGLKPIDILLSDGKRRFICIGSDKRILYFAAESGNCADVDIRNISSQPVAESIPFTSEFITKSFDFGASTVKKHIESIAISAGAAGKLKIALIGDTSEEITVDLSGGQYNCGSLNVIRLIPHIGAVKTLGLKLSSECGMEIGEISFNYREA